MNDGVSTQFRINCLINQKRIQNEGVGKKFPTPSFFNKCSGFFVKTKPLATFYFFFDTGNGDNHFCNKIPFFGGKPP